MMTCSWWARAPTALVQRREGHATSLKQCEEPSSFLVPNKVGNRDCWKPIGVSWTLDTIKASAAWLTQQTPRKLAKLTQESARMLPRMNQSSEVDNPTNSRKTKHGPMVLWRRTNGRWETGGWMIQLASQQRACWMEPKCSTSLVIAESAIFTGGVWTRFQIPKTWPKCMALLGRKSRGQTKTRNIHVMGGR